jgi:hypothetical protein
MTRRQLLNRWIKSPKPSTISLKDVSGIAIISFTEHMQGNLIQVSLTPIPDSDVDTSKWISKHTHKDFAMTLPSTQTDLDDTTPTPCLQ